MSRGLGAVQRVILDYLTGDPWRVRHREDWTPLAVIVQIVSERTGRPRGCVLTESCRRAVKTLADRGHLETDRRYHVHVGGLDGLHCRLSVEKYPTLTVAEPAELADAGEAVRALGAALGGAADAPDQ